MADLDFSHHVSQIPAGPDIKPYQGEGVRGQETRLHDYQGTLQKYAADTNWMSAIGSEVATRSSNAIAAKLGSELGKNPHGELGPSFTEFDKNFQASYNTQAASTLGLQAQKLITQSNLELAAVPRLNSEIISKSQNSVSQGLQKIYSLAPDSIRPNLEHQYGGVQLSQLSHLTERMLTEQKQDRIDSLSASIKIQTQNAYTFALSGMDLDKNGNSKVATSVLETINKSVNAALANHDITQLQALTAIDTARQTFVSGKYSRLADIAEKEGKLPEFLRSLADNPPSDINTRDHQNVLSNVLQHIQMQQNLRSQDENLKAEMMVNRIVSDPNAITDMDWTTFEQSVSPLKAEQVKFKFLQAMNKNQTSNQASQFLSQHWGDSTVGANSTPEVINKTFNDKVNNAVQKENLSRDDAEVMVASGSGFEIPVLTKTLKNKLKNANPFQVESGIQQIHKLLENGNGQALSGLSEEDWSMYSAAQSLRDSPDPIKANQDAHNRIYNQDPDVEKLRKTNWAHLLTKKNNSGKPLDQFALQTFGMSKGDFINPTIASAYGASILTKFGNFYAISGDYDEAKTSTQRWVDQNYGNTFVNGDKYKTLHPIEKDVGIEDRNGVPYIQQNIVEQLNTKLNPLKESYDKKEANEYWETIPINIPRPNKIQELKETPIFQSFTHAKENAPESKPMTIEELKFKTPTTLLAGMREQGRKEKEEKITNYRQPTELPSQEHGLFFKTYDPIKIKRHMRTAKGEKTETFDVVLMGNMFGDYDVAIQTKTGMRNLFREAPYLGIMSISPNKQEILDNYNGATNPKKKNNEVLGNIAEKVLNAIIPAAHAGTINTFDTSKFQFLKEQESPGGKPNLRAYQDTGGVWTIGYGHTHGVKKGDEITSEQAEKFFANDLKSVLNIVQNNGKVNFNANQTQALISFAHQEGSGALKRMINFIHNNPDEDKIRSKFLEYDVASDKKTGKKRHWESIKKRRLRELNLYFKK